MWQTHRISCITYHKYPKDDWPVAEFAEIETTLRGGQQVRLQLAERGTWIGSRKSGLWAREVRKTDHQWASGKPDQHGFWRIGARGVIPWGNPARQSPDPANLLCVQSGWRPDGASLIKGGSWPVGGASGH